MFAPALNVTLRILAFRAGPQDFPYDARLNRPILLLAILANVLVFAQVLPMLASVAMAAALVFGLVLVTRSLLRTRDLLNRYEQTINALLATTAVLTFLLVPLFTQVAPVLREIAQDPKLLENPEKLQLPGGVSFLMNLLNVWNLAVTAAIFRQAANIPFWGGILVALVAAFVVLMLVAFSGSLASALTGGA
ncbi:MAG TPA: hypothetical protein VFV11_02800 [Solimonas sp.]|nr:hypothetical protein [Solimonas sp.]